MMIRNQELNRLYFTRDYKEGMKDVDLIIIAVGTPQKSDGVADLYRGFGTQYREKYKQGCRNGCRFSIYTY